MGRLKVLEASDLGSPGGRTPEGPPMPSRIEVLPDGRVAGGRRPGVRRRAARGRPRGPTADAGVRLGAGSAPRAGRASRMTPSARAVAVEVVRRVADEGAYSTRVLPAALARSGLDERDRALATELAYGTLRHVPALDAAIGARAARPMARMTPGARAALRVGAYQVLHTRIPAHAAVSETVGVLVPRERGFVNAILRRIAKEPPSPPEGDDDGAVSLRTGLAPWAIAELRRILPAEEVEGPRSPSASAAPSPCTSTPAGRRSRRPRSASEAPAPSPRWGASIPSASSSRAATRRRSPDGTRAGTPCRIRHRRSSSRPWRPRRASGSSTSARRPAARPRSPRAASARTVGSSRGTCTATAPR